MPIKRSQSSKWGSSIFTLQEYQVPVDQVVRFSNWYEESISSCIWKLALIQVILLILLVGEDWFSQFVPADGRFGSSLSTVSLCYLTFQYNQRLVSHHTCECSSFEAVEVLLLLESNIEPPHSGSVKALLSYGGGVIDSKLEGQD